MKTIQETDKLQHWLSWPPKYAEQVIGELRKTLYSRFMASPNMRIYTSDLIDTAQKVAHIYSAKDILRELSWDVFCAINHKSYLARKGQTQ